MEMRRSKLESYEAILEALVKRPINVDKIAYKTNIDCTALTRYVDFLIKNGLVEERPTNKKTLYAITERGIAVLKTLNFQKYLENVTASLRVIDDASQTVPIISRSLNEQESKTE
jgi:predicted transcriptional regulator